MAITIKTSLDPSFRKKHFFLGSVFFLCATASCVALVFFAEPTTLEKWGLFLFLIALFFIRVSILHYRKLLHKDVQTDTIQINEEAIIFLGKGASNFLMPLHFVKATQFIRKSGQYGIGIVLRFSITEDMVLKSPHFSLEKIQQLSQKRFGVDFFFPFFTKESYEKLQAALLVEPFSDQVMHADDSH